MRLVLALALTLGFAAPAFANCGGHTTASTPLTTAETTQPEQSPLPAPVAAPVKK